ncbi:MAG: hypothetical protein WAO02_03855 [Verrucomicrobiia bacterium]
MNENEDNFQSLRRLLVLKRHESPPPGYFDNFSSQILLRIRAGDGMDSVNVLEKMFGPASALGKLLKLLDAKPVFASGFAGALCLLLLIGIVYAERPDLTPQPVLQPETTTASLAALSPTSLSQPASQMGIVSSTNPVFNLQPVAANFEQQNPLAQPVSFQVPHF